MDFECSISKRVGVVEVLLLVLLRSGCVGE